MMLIASAVCRVIIIEEHFEFIYTPVKQSVITYTAGMMIRKQFFDQSIFINGIEISSGTSA